METHWFRRVFADDDVGLEDSIVAEPGATREQVVAGYRDVAHMIEETGRHAGHADILREQIDGATGL